LRTTALVTAVVATAILATHARASTGQSVSQHDRNVIRFFANHPKQAAKPAGVAALWLILGHVSDALNRQTQSASVVSPTDAIRQVFGRYADQAIRVAYCESRLHPDATNGQYLGIFQEGNWARSHYGYGPDALTQARSAYAYFRDNGYSWGGAWSCAWAA
jgi:hypothetical protein